MTALGWICGSLGGLIAYLAACAAIGRFCGTNDRTERRAYPPPVPEPVRRMTVLPPVPPTTADWDRFLRLINEEAA